MDRQRIIIYTIVAALIAFMFYLNTYSIRELTPPGLSLPDRSQQSEIERGAGLFKDAKAHQKWMKEQEAWDKKNNIGN